MQNADEPAQSVPTLAPSPERKSAVAAALRVVLPAGCVLSLDEELRRTSATTHRLPAVAHGSGITAF